MYLPSPTALAWALHSWQRALPWFLMKPRSANSLLQSSHRKQRGCQFEFIALITRPMTNSPGDKKWTIMYNSGPALVFGGNLKFRTRKEKEKTFMLIANTWDFKGMHDDDYFGQRFNIYHTFHSREQKEHGSHVHNTSVLQTHKMFHQERDESTGHIWRYWKS